MKKSLRELTKECKRCGSTHLKKGGFQNTHEGKIQLYFCKDCGSHFQERKVGKPKTIWTEEKIKYLKENYKWASQKELCNTLKLSWKQIQAEAFRLKLIRRARGNQPTIEIEGDHFNYCKNKYGYILISNPDLGINHKMAHVYVWEKHYGQVPVGYEVHHKDGNPSNFNLSNLMLVKKGKEHMIANGLSRIINECHKTALEKGWWDYDINGAPTRNIGEAFMLIVSEIAEANEAYRNGDLENATEELADACIRIFDFVRGMRLPFEEMLIKKMNKNKRRPFRHRKAF